ncbi:alkylhydroperoxidase [Ornithinimicrobium sp. CNJ-824]|uniref:carboxymuconolactone decarboxylase family protein n=1 Tax=Ornithinimicrobium sp. CNJ-824 TaxID=1904966 RepID=UPI000969DEA3|nr:carboxymuconolactone decarboxylase family protein [Ornithinimicrobium sp. CNJ-824]OLT20524.1 alkylhydroperoxidase [Ornithinimicrobium sp. CNJ-824]
MQRIPAVTTRTAPQASTAALTAMSRRTGRTMAIHATMASSPAVINAYTGLVGALGEHGTLDAATRETIALTVAGANDCDYCEAAHTAAGRRAGLSEEQMVAARTGQRLDDPRLGTIADLAREATTSAGHVQDATWEAALAAGWTEEQLTETFTHVMANVFTNYFNHYAGTEIDLPAAPAA